MTTRDRLSEIEDTLAEWKQEPVHQPDFEWQDELEWLIKEVKRLRDRPCYARVPCF